MPWTTFDKLRRHYLIKTPDLFSRRPTSALSCDSHRFLERQVEGRASRPFAPLIPASWYSRTTSQPCAPRSHIARESGPRRGMAVSCDSIPCRRGGRRRCRRYHSFGAPAPLAAPPCGISRLVILSTGAINALRSSTGVSRSRCVITRAFNSSIEASSAIRAGLFGSPASFTALSRACRYGASNAAKFAAFSKSASTRSGLSLVC